MIYTLGPAQLKLAYIELSLISKATFRTKNHSINHLKSVSSKIHLSQIKSSAFKISSYAGPSVNKDGKWI